MLVKLPKLSWFEYSVLLYPFYSKALPENMRSATNYVLLFLPFANYLYKTIKLNAGSLSTEEVSPEFNKRYSHLLSDL